MVSRLSPERAAGLAFVLGLHAAALWGLWQHRLIPNTQEVATLFVNFIAPPPPEKKVELKPPPPKPKPMPIEKPKPRQIVAEMPVVAPSDYVAPPPPPAPVIEAPPAPPALPKAAGPIMLSGELSVACPERTSPRYPPHSRRMGEEGSVVLRVELDEHGNINAARVLTSSGFARLDDAALEAVRTWRCHPARRGGHPVRATALQPFNFVLHES
jgi:protein TonB